MRIKELQPYTVRLKNMFAAVQLQNDVVKAA